MTIFCEATFNSNIISVRKSSLGGLERGYAGRGKEGLGTALGFLTLFGDSYFAHHDALDLGDGRTLA